jgi:hypothetical protein
MRRIATVALAAGVALAGLGAVATTADAATHTWVTKDGWKTIKANGSYKRTTSSVSTSGYLHDTSNNGWSPAVQFKAIKIVKKNQKIYTYTQWSGVYFASYKGVPADFKFDYYYGHFFTSSYTTHLYVREAAIKESNRKTVKFAGWKKLY